MELVVSYRKNAVLARDAATAVFLSGTPSKVTVCYSSGTNMCFAKVELVSRGLCGHGAT